MEWRDTTCSDLPRGWNGPMQQHRLYGKACAALGARSRVLRFEQGGDAAGWAQVLIRRWPLFGDFALLSRGPVFHDEIAPATRSAATQALIRQLRRGLRGVMATPERDGAPDPLEASNLLTMVTPGHIGRLDLSLPREVRRSSLHGKWRNRLVRAEAADLRVRHARFPDDANHWLLRQETAQARMRGYRRLPASFTHAWAALGGRDATRLFTAHCKGVDAPVAAMLFLRHGATASYHIGWSGPEGRHLNAHCLLLWKASAWLARQGHRQLDLGTLDTIGTPGLARFKLGAGAQSVALGATRLDAPGTALASWLFSRARPAFLPQASSSASQ